MINLIACVANIKNELVIGKDGGLLFKLKKDMAFFKNITTDSLSKDSKLPCNVVVMGRKTYSSIPERYRPLDNRINLVLTRNPNAYTINPVKSLHNFKYDDSVPRKNVFFINTATFMEIYKEFNPNVFVIGGAEIYEFFLEEFPVSPHKLYITEVKGYKAGTIEDNGKSFFIKMKNFSSDYSLVGYSEKHSENELSFRFLQYKKNFNVSEENKYLDLANHILRNGNERPDRTGVGTISVFGCNLIFDISNGTLPLLTVKRVPFKAIFLELQWMMSGYTDNKILQDQGVHIWDGNTSREFLDSRGLNYREGILGPGYGHQIRHQGAEYFQGYAGSDFVVGFDQLQYVEDLLENDPFSRRIMMSYWNPSDFSKTALLPCHYSIQFYVEQIGNQKYLSGMFNMRSSDELARSWNCVFYTILVQILALRHNMKPKDLVYIGGDVHIYKTHIDAVKEYIQRTPRPFPKLWLSDTLKKKDWREFKFSDVELIGYFPHPGIKMDMAV